MHIHKPKTFHSLREFLAELFVITIGIIIALAGEQQLEHHNWAQKVAETRRALAVELGEDLGQGQLLVRDDPCADAQLDALADIVDKAAQSGRLPPLATPRRPPWFTWDAGVWRSAVSALTVNHMELPELKAYAETYEFITRIDEASRRQDAAWTTLYGLAGPGRAFDAQDAALFRQAIGAARFAGREMVLGGLRAQQLARTMGLAFDEATFRTYADAPLPEPAGCAALTGTPPAHYGAAPFANVAQGAEIHPVSATPAPGRAPPGADESAGRRPPPPLH